MGAKRQNPSHWGQVGSSEDKAVFTAHCPGAKLTGRICQSHVGHSKLLQSANSTPPHTNTHTQNLYDLCTLYFPLCSFFLLPGFLIFSMEVSKMCPPNSLHLPQFPLFMFYSLFESHKPLLNNYFNQVLTELSDGEWDKKLMKTFWCSSFATTAVGVFLFVMSRISFWGFWLPCLVLCCRTPEGCFTFQLLTYIAVDLWALSRAMDTHDSWSPAWKLSRL